MKILIAGEPESGQRQVLEKLTGKELDRDTALAGHVQSHVFTTRYFNAECGLWIDEYEDPGKWAEEFASSEAKEVRDALVLYIHTFDRAADANIAAFVDALQRPGISIAVPKPGTDVTRDVAESFEDLGFEVTELTELERLVHTALFDALDDEGVAFGGEAPEGDLREPPRDLDEIMQELQKARDSETMTKEEKMALAERLAEELI